jgi:RNA polymerase sigma-70 factor, ECF subfamily
MDRSELLVKDLKKGNQRALGKLYDTYAPAFLSIAFRYCGNRQDAEDVLHEGFIKIINNIHRFKSRKSGSFEGWMKIIIINTALNYLRDRAKDRKLLDFSTSVEPTTGEDEKEDQWNGIIRLIGKDRIMKMICDLSPGYRTIFNLYVFEEHTHKEIAEMLNCSESTSKTQLRKARAVLKTKIETAVEQQKVK